MLKSFIGVLFPFLMLTAVCATEFEIGTESFKLTPPDGMADARNVSPDIIAGMRKFTTETDELLAGLIDKTDAELFMAKRPLTYKRYIIIATPKKLIKFSASPNNFSTLKAALKKHFPELPDARREIGDLEKKISKTFSESYGIDAVKIEKIIPLGVDYEDESIFSTSMLFGYAASVGKEKIRFVQACSTTAVMARGKIIFVYAYNRYDQPADMRACREASLAVARSIVKENPGKTSAPSGKAKRGHVARTIVKIGVLLMVAVALSVIAAVRKRRSKNRE